MIPKLAIITSHPIQYNAPVFRMLSQRGVINIKVFYTWGEDVLRDKYDPGFGKVITWDIPLLEGYDYMMVKNVSKAPGSHHYKGIVNPTIVADIEGWGADAVLVFGWAFHSHYSVMRYFKGKIPVFFRGDSTLIDNNPFALKSLLKYFFLKRVYRHVDIAYYVGKANKSYFKRYGLKMNQLVFAPHAIDNQRFSRPVATDYRHKLSLKPMDKLILFAGKFEEKKDPLLLIQAFAKIKDEQLHLLLVGNGPLENEMKNIVSSMDNDISRRIQFLDFQNQQSMPDVYKACDLFVLPSKGPGETWGLAINEAMASSKAIIASNRCGAAFDLIEAGVNGQIFENGNVQALQSCIHNLISSKENLEQMGNESYSLIQSWSFENICTIIEQHTLLAVLS